jgi:hypothetical protein
MPDGPAIEQPEVAGFFSRLPGHIAAGLTDEQRTAIEGAIVSHASARPPVNIRVSVPLPGWRFYLAVMAGKERRNAARRRADRQRHPLHTVGNFLFILGGAMGFYILVLLAFLLNSSVLEY